MQRVGKCFVSLQCGTPIGRKVFKLVSSLEEYHQIFPSFSWGKLSHKTLVQDRKYWMDYNSGQNSASRMKVYQTDSLYISNTHPHNHRWKSFQLLLYQFPSGKLCSMSSVQFPGKFHKDTSCTDKPHCQLNIYLVCRQL